MAYANNLTEKIYQVLLPLVGANMAKAALKVACNKINTTEEDLTKAQLKDFSKNLERGLVIFIGGHRAQEIIGVIEKLA